jgi:hydrogenase maturation factor HypF (carbamoyltransferase family)
MNTIEILNNGKFIISQWNGHLWIKRCFDNIRDMIEFLEKTKT